MFTAGCPQCGAKVSLRASQSTTAVCGFCKSTLVRDADALKRIGVQGELLEDYSRVQIGTGGRHGGRQFTVVGRIQLRYDDGGWNEWYLLFDDGSTAWLSEASGQYAVTFDRGATRNLPSFDALRPGMTASVGGERYSVTDKRVARCTAGEGELPFPVDSRWEARVVDLRSGDKLLTIDWSEGDPPKLYSGTAVALDALAPTLLRGLAVVEETAGALPGGLKALECPACGASVRFVPNLAANVVCKQCKSELSGKADALVVEVERADATQRETWLALGDEATIDGDAYTLIGILARRTDDDPAEWHEYLLYGPKPGFRWVVQVGWTMQWVDVLNVSPELAGGGASVGGERYDRKEQYVAVTSWVVGSFNWRPKVGDRVTVTEFERGSGAARTTLSMEASDSEVTWSRAVEMPAGKLAESFGKKGGAAMPAVSAGAASVFGGNDKKGLKDLFVMFVIGLGVISLPAMIFGDWDELVLPLVIAGVALWAPLRLTGESDLGGGDD